jgi:hypothetical protein
MKVWGKPEAFRGLFFGVAMFFIPGIGTHIEFGALVGGWSEVSRTVSEESGESHDETNGGPRSAGQTLLSRRRTYLVE